MDDVAIRLENVSKYYKLFNSANDRLKEALNPFGKVYHNDFYALKNIDLEIKKGEILGIVGKNGSGKSTLLKLITGVLTPDEGTVTVNGKISALLELGSGFNPEFTGLQNIYFYGAILGFSKDEMEGKLDEILAFAEIGDFIHQPLKTYSSGMKSRLGFSVAVHIDPEILILDEVLSVGDALFQRKCFAKMEAFFEGGKTIIFVSHDINSVNELCSRAIFLFEARVLLDSDTRIVTNYYQKYIFSNNKDIKRDIEKISQEKQTLRAKGEAGSEVGNRIQGLDKIPDDPSVFFIPNFLPKTTLEYKNYDVDIDGLIIRSQENEKVNVLRVNEKYIIKYRVKFNINASSVSFGFTIKNDKGIVISGEGVGLNEVGSSVVAGDEVFVEKEFYCNLVNGNYYLTVGVTSIINGERKSLSRIVDGLVFKVLKSDNNFFGYSLLNGNMSAHKKDDIS